MSNKVKTYIYDMDFGVGISGVIFGALVLLVMCLALVPMLLDPEHSDVAERAIPLVMPVLISIGILIFGISKLVSYSKKKSEREDLMCFGTKLKGVVKTIDIAGNRRSDNDSSDPVRVKCVVTDPETASTRYFTSHPVFGNLQTISGMTVDIYVYPGNESNYYVDLKSARYIAPEGITKVHDFR